MHRHLLSLIALSTLSPILYGAGLSGKVVEDQTNGPLASVDVRLSKTGQPRLVADLDTDPAGNFNVPRLPPGEYRLELSKPGFIGATLNFSIATDADNVAHQFRLIRGGVISGQASDAQGRPIPGAFAYAMPKPAEGDSFRPFEQFQAGPVAQTVVDSNGRFRLYNLPPGQYAVAIAWGATRQRAAQSGSSSALTGLGSGVQFFPSNSAPVLFQIFGGEQHQANFLINSVASYTVSGKIDRELKPNEGNYWLALTVPEQPGLAIVAAQTEKDGTFRFGGVPPGTYDLLASGPSRGYGGGGGILEQKPLFTRMRVTVAGQNVEGLVVSPAEARSASFVLKRTNNSCPDTANLSLNSLEDWTVVLRATQSINTKPQTVDHLAPGRYRASASVADNTCFAVPRTITVGDDTTPIEIAISPGGSIRGHVRGTGDSSKFLTLLFDPEAPADPVRIAHPDATGAFTFEGLHPGRYRIAATDGNEASHMKWMDRDSPTTAVDVPAGSAATVDLNVPSANSP